MFRHLKHMFSIFLRFSSVFDVTRLSNLLIYISAKQSVRLLVAEKCSLHCMDDYIHLKYGRTCKGVSFDTNLTILTFFLYLVLGRKEIEGTKSTRVLRDMEISLRTNNIEWVSSDL